MASSESETAASPFAQTKMQSTRTMMGCVESPDSRHRVGVDGDRDARSSCPPVGDGGVWGSCGCAEVVRVEPVDAVKAAGTLDKAQQNLPDSEVDDGAEVRPCQVRVDEDVGRDWGCEQSRFDLGVEFVQRLEHHTSGVAKRRAFQQEVHKCLALWIIGIAELAESSVACVPFLFFLISISRWVVAKMMKVRV